MLLPFAFSERSLGRACRQVSLVTLFRCGWLNSSQASAPLTRRRGGPFATLLTTGTIARWLYGASLDEVRSLRSGGYVFRSGPVLYGLSGDDKLFVLTDRGSFVFGLDGRCRMAAGPEGLARLPVEMLAERWLAINVCAESN